MMLRRKPQRNRRSFLHSNNENRISFAQIRAEVQHASKMVHYLKEELQIENPLLDLGSEEDLTADLSRVVGFRAPLKGNSER